MAMNDTATRPLVSVVLQSFTIAAIMLLAIVGNALVVLALWKFRSLRSTTFVFIINLAVADFSVGLFGMPFILASSIAGEWITGQTTCLITGAISVIFCVASMLTLVGVSLDRYFAIVHPFRYPELMTRRRIVVLLVCIWLGPVLFAITPLLTPWTRYKYFPNEYICTIDWGYSVSYSCTIFAFAFFVPLLVMCYCYLQVLKVARNQSRKIGNLELRRARQLKRNAKSAVMLLVIVGNFLACWLPHFVGILCIVFTSDHCPFADIFFTVTTWLAMANSAMNPLIYGLMDRRLREAVLKIIRCQSHQNLRDPTIFSLSNQ